MANGVTDPTGGVKNFDIQAVFESFGYTPTQAEIDALAPAFEGRTNVGQTGDSAVAQYVMAHQQEMGAQSLIQGQLQGTQAAETAAQGASTADYASGAASYNQAQQTLESAPQLFGSMNPSQVSQYLAPLQNQFNYGLGQVTGQAASRGLAGSSLEAQAMAQAQQQFQQNVLSQGLSIGQQQQQLLAQSQEALGAQQFGAGATQGKLGLGYGSQASQLLGQNTGIAGNLANLPSQSVAQGLSQEALIQQMNPQTPSPWGGLLGTGLGAVAGGFVGGPLGAGIGASLGGQIGSAATGNPMGAQVGGSLGNTTLMAALIGKGLLGNFGSGGGSGGGMPSGTETGVDATGGLQNLG